MTAMPELTPEQIASVDLAAYVAAQFPGYQFGAHHIAIIDALERVERGECKRLMVFMPPRHGKSMLISEYFPAWFLGRRPGKNVITSSYSAELAEDFGRKVRNQLTDETWQAIFPHAQIDNRTASASRIDMMQGGSYMAVGVGGSATGRGAHLFLIDDPVKGREEADSETYRRRAKDWYASVAYTRLQRGGAIIVIMTRWHEDDLAGWILNEHQHEGWEVLSLPAVADASDSLGRNKNEALWPDAFPLETLNTIKQTIGPREWLALYQQRPAPDEGAYFKREWFQFYDALPAHLRFYGASDYAVTADGGDYTVHVVAGVDPDDNIFVVDMWRGQTDSLDWVEAFLVMLKAWKPQVWAEEQGVILKSLGPIIRKRLAEERLFSTYRKQFTSATDKPTRARSLQARMQMGKVFFPAVTAAPWMPDLWGEMLSFPAGKNDDQVDALALLARMMGEMEPASMPKEKPDLATRVAAWTAAPPTYQEVFERHLKKRKREN